MNGCGWYGVNSLTAVRQMRVTPTDVCVADDVRQTKQAMQCPGHWHGLFCRGSDPQSSNSGGHCAPVQLWALAAPAPPFVPPHPPWQWMPPLAPSRRGGPKKQQPGSLPTRAVAFAKILGLEAVVVVDAHGFLAVRHRASRARAKHVGVGLRHFGGNGDGATTEWPPPMFSPNQRCSGF